MALNGEMALILHYFTEFVYDVVVKQLLGLPRFQILLLIVYDHIMILIPFARLFSIIQAKQTLITRFDDMRGTQIIGCTTYMYITIDAQLQSKLETQFNARRLWPLHVRYCRKTLTFAISSSDELLYIYGQNYIYLTL